MRRTGILPRKASTAMKSLLYAGLFVALFALTGLLCVTLMCSCRGHRLVRVVLLRQAVSRTPFGAATCQCQELDFAASCGCDASCVLVLLPAPPQPPEGRTYVRKAAMGKLLTRLGQLVK